MTAVSEIERTELVNQLVATIGEGPAETLMKCVLPNGRDQLATKDDLRVLEAKLATKEDLRVLEAKMATKEDLRVLEAKMATKEDLRVLEAKMATKEELAEFATKKDLQILAAELRTEMAKQARVFFMALTGFMFTIWGTLVAQFFV